MKNLKQALKELQEEKPGLWANIRAKKARGEKPAHKNSNAHKDAVKAGKKINALNEDKADAVRWFGNLKYYYQKAFAELKGEDRETYKQLAKDFFSKLEIDQHVLPVGLDEGWNDDIDKVSLIYTNYGDLYKVKIDGKTVNAKDVEGLVGMEIPDNGFDTESINQFIDELKRKG